MSDIPPGNSFHAKHRLPWLVAAGAIVFALIVLVRSEMKPEQDSGTTVIAVPAPTPRSAQVGTQAPSIVATPQSTSAGVRTPPIPATTTPVPSPTPVPATYTLAGIVTDSDGKPLPKAAVRATYTFNGSQQSLSAASDAQGLFSFEGIRSPDLDVLIVEADSHGRNVIEKLKLPLPDRLEISLSALAGLEIAVQQATGDATGPKPFQGDAEFLLLQQRTAAATTATLGLPEAAFDLTRFVPVAQQHVSIRDGALRLEELEPGIYKSAIRSKDMYAESLPFTIEGAHRTQTTITLGLKYTMTGTVAAETDQRPISQAGVRLAIADTHALASSLVPHQAFTDGDGRFMLPGIAPGTYGMTIAANGFTTKSVDAITVTTAGPPADTTYSLTQQQPGIRVVVSDGEGRPVPNTRLVLMMTRPVNKTMFSQTDDAGIKLFDNISPGSYTIAVTAPADRTRQKSVDLELEDGQTTDVLLTFPKTTHVQGHARKNGALYQGLLTFSLRGSVGMQTIVKTDETGGYVADLEPGEYMVGSPDQPSAQVLMVGQVQAGNLDVEVK